MISEVDGEENRAERERDRERKTEGDSLLIQWWTEREARKCDPVQTS